MRIVQKSPVWALLTFLAALLLVVWGVSLVVDVKQRQKEVRDHVSLISRLSSLENSIRSLEKEIFGHRDNIPANSALLQWQKQYSDYAQKKEEVFSENDQVVQSIRHTIGLLDSSVARMDVIYSQKILANPGFFQKRAPEIEFRNEMNHAIDRLKEATDILRNRLDLLSAALDAKWQSLTILVFVACLLSIWMTIVLYFYQRDLAKRKRTEKILRQLTAEFRAMFKSIPDAVVFTDTNREIIMVNPVFTFLFGYQPEEVIGKAPDFLFNNKKGLALHDRLLFNANEPNALEPCEIKFQRKNGEVFISETVGTIVKYAEEDVFGFLSIIRDITKRKQAEEALSEAHDKLELWVNERTEDLMRANDEVKRFAYIVSHDLRAPLVNIKGFSGELREAYQAISSRISKVLPHLEEERKQEVVELLEEEIPEALQFIDSSASRMGNLIDAVLKLSRLGRRDLHFERINGRVVVQKVLESLAHQIEQREVTVKVNTLPRVMADRTSLEQVFGNILVNAINYLDPERKGEIEIGGKRCTHDTTYYVRDNGRGISEEDMPKVFEPFSRAGNPDVPGEGMGLAYVQTLIRRHGGRIWCESKLGVGTTFRFTLPNHATNGNKDE